MPDTPQLLAFIAAGLLLNLTPGPDVFFILTNAVRRGARAGLVAALGITAGCCVHIVAAAVGVSALVAASATAFTVLKWVGAAYLVYVGIAMLFACAKADAPDLMAASADRTDAPGTVGSKDSLWVVFRRGFLTNTLNPKVALFFLAFVPQFIAPGAAHPSLAFLALGLLFNFNALWVNFGWALAAAWMARRVGAVQQGMRALERVAGAIFIGFGIKLALTDSPSSH
ncbi:MAG: LysE family translocator [Variovorax sp.]|nr:MAG: LysE family translocator [Variovorax sp.]